MNVRGKEMINVEREVKEKFGAQVERHRAHFDQITLALSCTQPERVMKPQMADNSSDQLEYLDAFVILHLGGGQ